jgi:hypothetical protein
MQFLIDSSRKCQEGGVQWQVVHWNIMCLVDIFHNSREEFWIGDIMHSTNILEFPEVSHRKEIP